MDDEERERLWQQRERDERTPAFGMFFFVILMLLCLYALYQHDRQVCAERGGHLEGVTGGHGGWVCVGAP